MLFKAFYKSKNTLIELALAEVALVEPSLIEFRRLGSTLSKHVILGPTFLKLGPTPSK